MITKFKAWKKNNYPEMFEDIRAIDFEKNIIKIGYKLSEQTTRIDEESLDNVILLQSTGLKDKNFKEIYEGDVVKIDNHPLQVHKAPFSGLSIGLNINGNYVVEYSTEDMAYFIGNWKTREVIRHSEVIGNKFENPELLREE